MDTSIGATQEKRDLRDGVVKAVTAAVETGSNVVVLVSDSTSTSKIGPFAARFPDRLVNVGIAEQNLIGVAAGFSLQGFVPITMNAACFLLNRSNEQVKNDVCYSNTNVKLVGLNAGVAYGPLASTHHSIDDISILRGFGNIQIWAPCDAVEAEQMMQTAIRTEGPVYIRLDNASFPVIHGADYRFQPGVPDVLATGKDLTICAVGSVVHEAWSASQRLKAEGVDVGVVNVSSLRPLDKGVLASILASAPRVLTVEEHSVSGGLGSIVAEIIAEGISTRLTRLGIPEGKFSVSGPREQIRAFYGLDQDGIVSTVHSIV